jgi:hypothetical protein
MSEAIRSPNNAKSKIRSCVEQFFAEQKERMDLLVRGATTEIRLANLYNFKRLLFLQRRATASPSTSVIASPPREILGRQTGAKSERSRFVT